MKKKVLLLDESLTVQKVVALTLDRNRYAVSYAKSRSEAMKWILETPPDLILVSDQVADINVSLFPKEVESWMGRDRRPPPIILITGQDVKEARAYQAVLRKPFSPQALQAVVVEHTARQEEIPRVSNEPSRDLGRALPRTPDRTGDRPDRNSDRNTTTNATNHLNDRAERTQSGEDVDDHRLQRIFSDTFADEEKLTRETFQNELDKEERTLLTIPAPPRNAPKAPSVDDDEIWPPAPDPRRDARPARPMPPARSAPPPPPETAAELWGALPMLEDSEPETPPARPETSKRQEAPAPSSLMGAEDSMAYKATLENKVDDHLRAQDLDQLVAKHLQQMLPPIVERLVQERLDNLLKEQEDFEELKP